MPLLRVSAAFSNPPPDAASPPPRLLRAPMAWPPEDRYGEILGDDALVARLRQGDDAAYETLVRAHGPRLFAVARGYMSTPEDAEDVLLSAFPLVIRFIEGFDGATSLSAWMQRIVVNCAQMRRRILDRRPEDGVNALALEAACVAEDKGQAASLAEGIAQREAHGRLLQGVGRLSDIVRASVRLREVDRLSRDETSRLPGRSLAALRARVQWGRIALRVLLSSRDDGPCSSLASATARSGSAAPMARTRRKPPRREHVEPTAQRTPSVIHGTAHIPHVDRGATCGGVTPHQELVP